jgi:butyryl-CoA dehydrogenase
MLHEWLRVDELTKRERFAEHSRETFDAVLALAEQLATREFAPHNRAADLAEPHVEQGRVVLLPEVRKAVSAVARSGLLAATHDFDRGGMQLPVTVANAAFAWLQAANIATAAYVFLTIANANLLVAHGSQEQVDTYVLPMLEGRFLGTMCLSEPQAGSSLADITTSAVEQPDGSFRLTGHKMWISAGEHELAENIVHLVLARIPGGPPGVKGISLFLVPRFLVREDGSLGARNDVVLAGVNHKMGYRGTVNTVLNFGEGGHTPGGTSGAVGFLVGARNEGLAIMFHMMNEARIGIGLGASALAYTGYLHSADYARTRLQGRATRRREPDGQPVAIIEHPDVRRMLLAQKSYAEGGLALGLYCARLVDDIATAEDPAARERTAMMLDVLTPIAKSWPSQWGVVANDLAIQVHGGYGYTRDYPVEQFYRDNRLNPIHEGTNGIQALDLLGRKVVMHGGRGLRALLEVIASTSDRARGTRYSGEAEALDRFARRIEHVTTTLHGTGDPDRTLMNASIYLEAFGHIAIAWIWLEQLLATGDAEGVFYDGKRAAAAYFYRFELPRVGPQLDLLESLEPLTLATPPDLF